jgi:hypothetical protein
MSDFAKIEAAVKDLSRRVQTFNKADWVMLYVSHVDALWRASSCLSGMASVGCEEPFMALSQLEEQIRRMELTDTNFAKTLGLEAAE